MSVFFFFFFLRGKAPTVRSSSRIKITRTFAAYNSFGPLFTSSFISEILITNFPTACDSNININFFLQRRRLASKTDHSRSRNYESFNRVIFATARNRRNPLSFNSEDMRYDRNLYRERVEIFKRAHRDTAIAEKTLNWELKLK